MGIDKTVALRTLQAFDEKNLPEVNNILADLSTAANVGVLKADPATSFSGTALSSSIVSAQNLSAVAMSGTSSFAVNLSATNLSATNLTASIVSAGTVSATNLSATTVSATTISGALLQVAGSVVQMVCFSTTASSSGSTTIPVDETVPQNDEGTQFMSAAITPTNASNILFIYAMGSFGHSNLNYSTYRAIMCLFKDDIADAYAVAQTITWSGNVCSLSLAYRITAGTTNEIIYKIRAGSNLANPFIMNASSTNNVAASGLFSALSITEIMV